MGCEMTASWDLRTYRLWHGQTRMSEHVRLGDPSMVLVASEGSWVIDAAGRKLLDARAGIANMQLGYSRRDIVEAMYQQALRLPYACVIRYERPALATLEYAERLVSAAPVGLSRVRLTHMGSASVENALLMSRLYQRNLGRPAKSFIVSLQDGYHGTTLMTMAASGEPKLAEVFGDMPDGFVRVPKPRAGDCPACSGETAGENRCGPALRRQLADLNPDLIAAFIVEPVMGNRVWPIPAHYLKELRSLCDEFDILLIFDEVVTGFGRLGSMFAAEFFQVVPDILCMSKGVTAGYAPMGAVLVAEKVFAAFDLPDRPHFPNGSSTDGHPVPCAAALQVLRIFEQERVVEASRKTGAALLADFKLRLGGNVLVGDVRGHGLLIGIEILETDGRPAELQTMRAIEAECDRRGLLIQYGHNVIALYPPLTITGNESNLIADTVVGVLDALVERRPGIAVAAS